MQALGRGVSQCVEHHPPISTTPYASRQRTDASAPCGSARCAKRDQRRTEMGRARDRTLSFSWQYKGSSEPCQRTYTNIVSREWMPARPESLFPGRIPLPQRPTPPAGGPGVRGATTTVTGGVPQN